MKMQYESVFWNPEEETLGHLLGNLGYEYFKMHSIFKEHDGLYLIILQLFREI